MTDRQTPDLSYDSFVGTTLRYGTLKIEIKLEILNFFFIKSLFLVSFSKNVAVLQSSEALIKKEVEKQIKQYFEEHKDIVSKLNDNNNASTTQTTIVNRTELNDTASKDTVVDQPLGTANDTEKEEYTTKRNDKESNDGKRYSPIKIEAQNVYGNSVGNEKVTNIFIFNISKKTDLENVKPMSNGTNGVYAFGLDSIIPNQEIVDKDKISDAHNSENKTETNIEHVTPKPEATNDHNNEMESPMLETGPVNDQTKENISEETSKDRN